MSDVKEVKIEKITAEEIFDSRGNPTIKVTVFAGGEEDSFSVPSGASTGINEAYELKDFDGRGVTRAIQNVTEVIAPALIGKNVLEQKAIDVLLLKLDGTKNKIKLGGNSILGVSIACSKVAAKVSKMELFEYLQTLADIKPSRKVPYVYMNLINGGKHANNILAFQEYIVVPDTDDVARAVDIGLKIQKSLEEIIKRDLGEDSLFLGDEGGFAPQTGEVKKPFHYFVEALRKNDLEGKVRFAIDAAATTFHQNGFYKVGEENFSRKQMLDFYDSIMQEFKLLSIEDPFYEEDFADFAELRERNSELIVVGDDLTVTNATLVEKAIMNQSINGLIVKPNQIGTLTETLHTMKLAREHGIELVVSHRSGETKDTFIADLAFAFGCFAMKAGSPVKEERMVKYQRLIEISKKA